MKTTIWNRGDLFIWLTGTALASSLIMVTGLIITILVNGLSFFWPSAVTRFALTGGRTVQGEIMDREPIPDLTGANKAALRHRLKLKLGNRDLYGSDFAWVDEDDIASRSTPPETLAFERREWGNFYGTVKEFRAGGQSPPATGEQALQQLRRHLPSILAAMREIQRLEKDDIGAINHRMEKLRLRLRKLALRNSGDGPEAAAARLGIEQLQQQYAEQEAALDKLKQRLQGSVLAIDAAGREKELPLAQILRVWQPNTLSLAGKCGFFLEKIWEFIAGEPREANTEGGIFPAIFGTVMMVLLMSLFAAPLGVLAAFYLREYAKPGPFVSLVRIAVNNLAGVPSIVFGVFGLGFFIYTIGGAIDRVFFPESLPTPVFGTGGILWASLTLALLTVPVVIVSTEEGLAAVPNGIREASLALGATKFETLWRTVLPAVMPSILTGLILAMARAAGEVAPLMITGVVKLAPALPVDTFWPFIHPERKFMHLGFHIYDVGFQSPNVDAAQQMVFATTLLLIAIVLLLNLAAIVLRNRLRQKSAITGL